MKRVITYGTFDLFHYGHANFLRKARECGDYLIVGLSSDDFNLKKGKVSVFPFAQRKIILESIRYVDKVIEEHAWEQKPSDIFKYDIDVFVMGGDWQNKFDYLDLYCKVIYLPRTENISSSHIKRELQLH